ncbi:MAG: phage morphogenesis protein, partial [Proteobacteria bacterium]|nr:phage morphogenesis protein [Pseudomonadota bacterium]
RSVRIVDAAKRIAGGAKGTWGSTDTVYARRIELGFQGKDARGRVVDAPAFPFLIPAAQVEYPKLARRIRVAL